jgi:hypothetical protein
MMRLLLPILILGFVSAVSAQQPTLIAGRAVDEQGEPIANALITIDYPACANCIDKILPSARSLPDGVFFIEWSGTSFNRVKLFAEGSVPQDFWSPISGAPFYGLSHVRLFRGIPLHRPRRNSRIDLGNVTVKIRYNKRPIDLGHLFGGKFVPARDSASALNFVLRDAAGHIIYDGSLPDAAYDRTFSKLNLALPRGKWILWFSLNQNGAKINRRRLVINVRNDTLAASNKRLERTAR